MSLFGVQLNVQLNRLQLQIRRTISNSKTKIFLHDIEAAFHYFDTKGAGLIHLENFTNVLHDHRIILKQWEYQVFLKAYPADYDSGYLYWTKFIQGLVVPLCQQRATLLNDLWDYINVWNHLSVNYQHVADLLNVTQFVQCRDGLKSDPQLKNEMFHRFKFNAEGGLTKQEFLNFYQHFNCNYPKTKNFKEFVASHWKFPLRALDHASDARTVISQFRKRLLQITKNISDEDKLREYFNQLNGSGRGRLSIQDLQNLLGLLGMPIGGKHLEMVFARLDVNGSGYIEFNEFKSFL